MINLNKRYPPLYPALAPPDFDWSPRFPQSKSVPNLRCNARDTNKSKSYIQLSGLTNCLLPFAFDQVKVIYELIVELRKSRNDTV